VSNFLTKNLVAMRSALDHHNRTCGDLALAFWLNPLDHALLGFDELWGVPVRADERMGSKDFHLACMSDPVEWSEECDRFAAETYAQAPV
jgi:hypothetical protein